MSIRNSQANNIVTQSLISYFDALGQSDVTNKLVPKNNWMIPTHNSEYQDYVFYKMEGSPSYVYDNYKSAHIRFNNSESYKLKTYNQSSDILQSYFGNNITISLVLTFESFVNYRGIYGLHNSGILAQCEGGVIKIGYYPAGTNNAVSLPTSIFYSGGVYPKVHLTHTIENGSINKVYINGKLYGQSTFGTTITQFAAQQFYIGKSYATTGRYMTGDIYNIALYNRALNANEVLQNYYYLASRFIN